MSRKIITDADRRKSRRSVLLGVAITALVLLLGVIIFAAISYLRLTAKPPAPPEASQAVQIADVSGQPPITLDDQFELLSKAVREGRYEPFAINMRPVDLQAELQTRLRDKRVEDLHVYFGEGTVVAQGKTSFGDRRLYATIRVRPRTENGKLLLDVQDARLGTLPMPGRLRQELQRELDKAIEDRSPEKTGVWLQGVTVSPYGMTLQGQTQQRRP